jgi:hypothetical protein
MNWLVIFAIWVVARINPTDYIGSFRVRARTAARVNLCLRYGEAYGISCRLLIYFPRSGQRSSSQTHSVSSSRGVDRSEYGHAARSYDHLSHRESLQGVVGRGLG